MIIPLLLETLQQADKVDGPVLIHVITVKGKGYKPAEADSHNLARDRSLQD